MTRRRYTETQFRAAAADPATKTIADLCRALGLVPRGGNDETVLDYADELGVALDRLQRPSVRHIDDTNFLAAVVQATSYPDLCRRLGLSPRQNTYRRLRARARLLGHRLPTAWSRPGPRPTGRRATAQALPEAEVRRAVLGNFSIADTLRDLDLPPTAGTYARFAASVDAFELDTSHFGSRGRRVRQDVAELLPLLGYGPLPPFTSLGRQLVRVGLKRRACERCGITSWQGEPVPLELDHANGDRRDNRLQNLRLLCPNCHALTPTFRGRNRGARAARSGREPVSIRPAPATRQLAFL